ncbi:MAG: prephenate dehydrogenase [Candidatus Margulisiibacteriota bacterium]
MTRLNTIAIVGLGLIGGSLAKAFKAKHPALNLIGIDPNPDTLVLAKPLLTRAGTGLHDIPDGVDLVFVCTPISQVAATLNTLATQLKTPTLLTDVASVKAPVLAGISEVSPHLFISGHPMAGKAETGFAAADASLFDNAPYILIPPTTPDPRYTAFKTLIQTLTPKTVELDAPTHDRLLAYASHLPYVLASVTAGITALLSDKDQATLATLLGPGFRDTTRVSGSSPHWGCEVLEGNKNTVLQGIEAAITQLSNLQATLKTGHHASLLDQLFTTQTQRNTLIPPQ